MIRTLSIACSIAVLHFAPRAAGAQFSREGLRALQQLKAKDRVRKTCVEVREDSTKAGASSLPFLKRDSSPDLSLALLWTRFLSARRQPSPDFWGNRYRHLSQCYGTRYVLPGTVTITAGGPTSVITVSPRVCCSWSDGRHLTGLLSGGSFLMRNHHRTKHQRSRRRPAGRAQ